MQALRLISTKELTHDDWLDHRRTGLGGSDIAAICGMSRYKSAMEVYLDKLGEIPPLEDNPKMKAGRMLEPVIAEWFAEETGMRVQRQNSIFQHKQYPHMLANIDRWLPGLNAGLEIKNTGEYSKDDWSGTQAPTEYILQCNHYMAVTGADKWFICVLIGGWDLQWKVIERDEALINNLITIENDFWNNNVLAKNPPALSHQDTKYLTFTYSDSKPNSSVDLPEETYSIMETLIEARKAKEVATVAEETAKNQIKGIMQNKELAYWQGDLRFTWKANKNGVRSFKIIGGNE